jgi:hypothetical protein
MNENTTDESTFVEIDRSLYGEVIHIKTPQDYRNYKMYVNLFGDGSQKEERWDELT